MELKINNRKIPGKICKYLDTKNRLLYNPWVKEAINRKIRNYYKLSENKNKISGMKQKQYSDENLYH